MASLKDIRRRIGSVKSTQQITKAMKMVAAARLRRAQQAIASARPFAEKLEKVTQRVITELQNSAGIVDPDKKEAFLTKLNPLLKSGASVDDLGNVRNKIALVIVSSDRGLCGAYNTNVVKYAQKRVKELQSDSTNEITAFYVGKKAAEVLKKRGLPGEIIPDIWQGKFTTKKADQVAKMLTDRFLSGEFSAVEFVFTQFKSAISQTTMHKRILPMAIEAKAEEQTAEQSAPFIYEPKREELLNNLLPALVKTNVYRILADSLASEFGAKMTSMDNATRNAGDMISRLTLESNRVRQAGITKELMEIVSGAEALK